MAVTPTSVCVLGMHRSGTSLATGILAQLGVFVGSEANLMAPAPDNPKGFWELDPVRDLNDEILAALGGTWDEPPTFPPRWEGKRKLRPLRDRAGDLIRSEFEGRERWAWKDPRTSLTLPLWRRVTPPMRYVVCVRNPLEVAASLLRRNGIELERGAALWTAYSAAAVRNTSGDPRIVVTFEELLEGDGARRLASFAGIEIDSDGERRVGEFVASELRHEASDAREALASDAVAPRAKALYAAMLAVADGQRAGRPDPSVEEALRVLVAV